MRRINVSALKSGVKLGRPVYSSGGDILLKAGTVLNDGYIKKLKKIGVSFVFVEDDQAPQHIPGDVVARDTRVAAVKQVKDVLLETKETGKLVIDPQSIYSTVSEFTDQLLSSNALVYSLYDLRSQDDYTFAHSVNVCVLSLLTGITLGYSNNRLMDLGLGAILHDIGKMKVPTEVLNKPGKLTEDEFKIIKQHTVLGHELIENAGNLGRVPSTIAYQHHESLDGSGYPLGVSGDQFSEYAQIVSIADKFDALTANRVYHSPFPAHEAYEMCAGSGSYWFSERVVKAFLYNIAAYPEGTPVKLSNGLIAVALDTPKGHSLFPKVRVVLHQDSGPFQEPYEIALYARKDIQVVSVLEEDEFKELMGGYGDQS
ncbi:MAG: phosphodiesterase [Peptococcaceae bacterium BICA1-7]|nr:MAG: phosphodiesterase [Peptococcaceae bacterium BICA1-7]HBV95475.1 HD-GYP domain-containing protein [Desulfotomaculum sp.]